MNKHNFIYLFVGLLTCLALIVAFIIGVQTGLTSTSENYESNILPALSVVGVWFGAISTSCVAIVSLWLAYKQLNKDKEILEFHLNMLVSPGYQDIACIGITIVSKGNKPSSIESISWLGKTSSVAMLVSQFNTQSATLPAVLSYGQRICILHEEGFELHLSQYIKEHLNGKVDDLYMTVNTTTDQHEVKLSTSVREKILESLKC